MSAFGGFGNFGAQANASGQPATSTQGATGSPFGAFGQNQQQQQQQQPQAGASTTGAFGSSPFGASSTTGTAGTQGTGTTGGGLFGSTPTAPAINVSTPGGSSTTPLFPSSGGAFGQSLNPPATGTASTSTSNLFPPASGTTAGAGTSTTSPFGSFGQQQPQQQNTNTAGPSMFKPSVFGAAPTTGFGASTAQPAQNTGAFGQSTLGSSVLGASTLNLGQSTAGGNANAHTVEAQISAIEAAMTPGSPNNRFQYYFYNLVDADQIHLYGRPANATNETLWQRANRENPNPSRLVPALAVGFEDLKKRADAQQQQIEGQSAAVRLLKREVEKLSTTHTLTVLPLAHRLTHTHAQLVARLTALIHHLHLFIPSLRGASLRPPEEALRTKLEALEKEVSGRSDSLGRVGGRMAELWGVVGRVKAQKEAGQLFGSGEQGGWAVVDPAAFEEIKNILVSEQQGLKFLTEVLRTALRDVELVRSGFGGLDLSSSTAGP